MIAAAIEPEPAPASSQPEPEQWALAYTHPREEFRAKENLDKAKFDVYLPTRWKWMRPRFSTKQVLCEVPRFERYLFVGIPLDPAEDMRWDVIKRTPGVVSYLANSAGVPLLLPRKIIDLVRAQIAKEPKPETKAKRPVFVEGELLAVLSGIYASHRATFDRWEGEQARVFITMFNRQTAHKIDWKDLSSL